jgi:transposase
MEQDYAVRLALDWADRKHAWALQVTGENCTEQGELDHTPEAVEQFVVALAARFPGRKIAVALEQRKGALFYMLSKYAALDLYPVHPATLHHYRQSLYPSGAKSDPRDAALILEFLCRHPERLRPVVADSHEARLLAQLVQDRRAVVDEQTRAANQLTAFLKLYFPQVLEWFDADQPVLADLLRRWSTLEQLRRARPGTLAEFLRSHSVPEPKRQMICQQLAHAVVALADPAVLESAQGKVRHLFRQLSLLRDRTEELETRIGELTAAHPDRDIFASLPGAGPAMLPRLLAAFGTQRERFQSAQQLQCYSGIAPVQEASGKTKIVKWRWSCPTFLRQTFHEWAWLSTRRSVWARQYYDTQRERGKSHHAAVRALAFKWIRILFRCWQARTPYVESVYLTALQKCGAPVGISLKKPKALAPVSQLLA